MFAERLDFLMELTNTRASSLGRACLLDASYISRLRNGGRALPKDPAFLDAMSLYFAKRIGDDYRKSVLCGMLKIDKWPSDEKKGAALVAKMLLDGPEYTQDVESILTGFSGRSIPKGMTGAEFAPLQEPKSSYYGPSGKREAVL